MKKIFILCLLLIVTNAFAAPPTRQYIYVSGEVIDPDNVTENEDVILNYLQTGVDTVKDNTIVNADIYSGAAIQASKLSLGSIAQDIILQSDNSLTYGTDPILNGGTFTANALCSYDSTTGLNCNLSNITIPGSLGIASTLGVVGAAEFESTVDIAGALTVQGTIDGESLANDSIDDDSLDFSDITCADLTMTDCGALIISSLNVSGAVGLSSTLGVVSSVAFENNLSVAGILTVGGTIDGESLADDSIDDDSLDFSDITCADLTMTDCGAITTTSDLSITGDTIITGNVGIGTTALNESVNIASGESIRMSSNDSNTHLLKFYDGAAETAFINAAFAGSGTTGNDLIFGSDLSEYSLVIERGGNVGIGTTTPANKLDVSGSLSVSGSIQINGTIQGSSTGTSLCFGSDNKTICACNHCP